MVDSLAVRETQSVGIHKVLEGALGLIERLQTQAAIWKFLENLPQQSKRMNWSMTSFLVLNVLF